MSVDLVSASSINGGNFNRYWYGNNNPYKFVDPDGRQICRKSIGESCSLPPSRPAHWGMGGLQDFGLSAAGPATRPAIGKVKHAKRDRELQETMKEFSPDTYGADVEYDPNLNAAGSNIGAQKIIVGPKAFHFSKGYLASVVQHEGAHVAQDRDKRSSNYGQGAIDNEVEATRHQLDNAARFRLTPKEIQEIRDVHEDRYGPLPAE